MALKVNRAVTSPEVLDLPTVKSFLRVDFVEDDTLITSMITQAREVVEDYLSRSIVQCDVTATCTVRDELFLPYGPVLSIDSVKDKDGEVIDYTWNGFTVFFNGTYTVEECESNNFVITYKAGSDANNLLPAGLKLGLLETIAYLYDNRGNVEKDIMLLLIQNTNLMPYRNKVWI